jgi:hypothetical protein
MIKQDKVSDKQIQSFMVRYQEVGLTKLFTNVIGTKMRQDENGRITIFTRRMLLF